MPEQFADQLTELKNNMLEAGDEAGARKLADLIGKWQAGTVSVAMGGHFSAGKSSLINALCGRTLLPSGPIPTSANLVRIAYGPDEAVVYRGSHPGERIDLDQLAEACRDGATFSRIEIRVSGDLLSGGLELMDTPGVDSTDEAHREATESSLYLADAVFFVTDYNHVLSETNLFFLKKLEDLQKPYIVLVNQVDKHRQQEMDFGEYRMSVDRALSEWRLKPAGVLYLSVKHPDHPLSEWDRLIRLMEDMKEHARDIARAGIARSVMAVIREHVGRHDERNEESEEEIRAAVEEAAARLEAARRKRDEVAHEPEAKRQQFVDELGRLVDNAPLMPAEIRDLAGAYLESRKPGFKVGLFFSESKTKAEISSRLAAFHRKLQEQLESALVWHLNRLAGAEFRVELEEKELAEAVQDGAVITDAYTMNYCRMLEASIKNRYRRLAVSHFDETVFAALRREADGKLALLEEEVREAEAGLEEAESRLNARREKEALIRTLSAPFAPFAESMTLPAEWFAGGGGKKGHTEYSGKNGNGEDGRRLPVSASDERERSAEEVQPDPVRHLENAGSGSASSGAFRYKAILEDGANRLEEAAALLRDLPVLAAEQGSLLARAAKLRQHRFTAALFGAFSAGKSSFANALLGAPVLPVSPNPTTAAINAVLPPTGDRPHGTAVIRMKTEAALMDDLRYSLSMLGLSPEGIDHPHDAEKKMDEAMKGMIPARGRAHASFVRAAARGYDAVRDKLGTEWTAGLEAYRQYVADEEKSCFVASIDLHLASAFAEQGVVLVDTPGADSIHARHTGVTFEYIRQADAILFVTYYNHAFSRADRQFLDQLGRVKDAFELDKMFFLVNAADLADSPAELDSVLDYVRQELLRHGIREPRLFAVSSREGLEAKQTGDGERLGRSGFAGFESRFAHFASGELAETFLRAAEVELGNIHRRIRHLAEQSLMDAAERREKANRILATAPSHLAQLRSRASGDGELVLRELQELVHHVKKRCLYRFGEWFADAFHPSVLQQDGRDMGIALKSAWNTLIQAVTTDMAGELLATGLRMDRFVGGLAGDWLSGAIGRIQGDFPEWVPGEWEPGEARIPEPEADLGVAPVPVKELERRFRNAKSFFEGDGRKAMRDWLEGLLMEAASVYADRYAETCGAFFADRYERLLDEARDFVQAELDRFARAFAGDGTGGLSAAEWREKEEKLGALLKEFGLLHRRMTKD